MKTTIFGFLAGAAFVLLVIGLGVAYRAHERKLQTSQAETNPTPAPGSFTDAMRREAGHQMPSFPTAPPVKSCGSGPRC